MRKIPLLLLVVLVSALMASLAGEAAGGGASAAAKKVTVKLGDNFFKPDNKTVKKGTVVRFKWIGENPHNVVKKKGPGPNFASDTTDSRGVNFKKKFKKKGKYTLVCTIHDRMDMKLKVR